MGGGDGGWILARAPVLAYERALDPAWTLLWIGGGAAPTGLESGASLLDRVDPADRARVEVELAQRGDEATLRYRLAGEPARWVIDRGRREGARRFGVIVELPPHDALEEARRLERGSRVDAGARLELLGRFAGGVAHELNNTLTGVLGNATLLSAQLPPGGPLDALGGIEAAVARLASVSHELLAFAGKTKRRELVFDVATALAAAADRAEPTLGGPRLVRSPPALSPVAGDPSAIEELVGALIANARDALAGRGTITLTLAREELEGPAASRLGLAPGAYAVIGVADDGPGVPEELRARLFEPFVSNKPSALGLGLAAAYGVARAHGGTLALDPSHAPGARFCAYLPVAKARSVSDSSEQAVVSRRARVLLVDDEEFVRFAVRAQLAALGHEVLLARDGREAVEAYRAAEGAIDLVLLDLTMPRMDGAACFHALRALDPSVKVVLTSGFGRDKAVQDLLDVGVRGFLEKPFRQAELAAELARVLGPG